LVRAVRAVMASRPCSVMLPRNTSHPHHPRLSLRLRNPFGVVANLYTATSWSSDTGDNFGSGSASCDGIKTLFIDDSTHYISSSSSSPPFIDSDGYRPSTKLSTLEGLGARGWWELEAEDESAQTLTSPAALYCFQLMTGDEVNDDPPPSSSGLSSGGISGIVITFCVIFGVVTAVRVIKQRRQKQKQKEEEERRNKANSNSHGTAGSQPQHCPRRQQNHNTSATHSSATSPPTTVTVTQPSTHSVPVVAPGGPSPSPSTQPQPYPSQPDSAPFTQPQPYQPSYGSSPAVESAPVEMVPIGLAVQPQPQPYAYGYASTITSPSMVSVTAAWEPGPSMPYASSAASVPMAPMASAPSLVVPGSSSGSVSAPSYPDIPADVRQPGSPEWTDGYWMTQQTMQQQQQQQQQPYQAHYEPQTHSIPHAPPMPMSVPIPGYQPTPPPPSYSEQQ